MKKMQFQTILSMSWGFVFNVMDEIDELISDVEDGEVRPCAARKKYLALSERLAHFGGRFCRILNAANDYDSQGFRGWSSAPYFAAVSRFHAFFGV